jgi:hypothetical protein
MKRYDYVIIVLVVVIALGSLGFLTIKPKGGQGMKYVEISSENKLIKKIPLTAGTGERITVKNRLGENIVDISNGKIRIHDADCPDKICIKDGAISEPGDILVCLPNKVVIEIKGEKNNENDVISY